MFDVFFSINDNVLAAVIRNNIVTLNRDQAVFDSKKKMKLAVSEAISPRLLNYQRYTILYNNILLLLQTHQVDAARQAFKSLTSRFNLDHLQSTEKLKHILLEGALLLKENKCEEAHGVFQKGGMEGILTSVGILINQGKKQEAFQLLNKLESNYWKLAIVSLKMGLGRDVEVLKKAIEWYKKTNVCHFFSPF